MASRTLSRWPFVAAVALFAATVSDVLVEAVANTGLFGGAYFDTDDSSIVPALAVVALLALGVIGGAMAGAARRSNARRRNWFARIARDVATHAPLRDLRAVLAVQFGALYAMENAERLIAHGTFADGLLWLGGPAVIAIAAHALVGTGCTLAAGWLMRVSLPHFALLVCCALEFVLAARTAGAQRSFLIRPDTAACDAAQAACVRRICGRAPPFSALPV